MKSKILVSACLLGREVRYDGAANRQDSTILQRWRAEGRLVPVCPEVAGGLGVPRPPAEIVGGDGRTVHEGNARVVTNAGDDVTDAFTRGAELALKAALDSGSSIAVLKARSPSCGSGRIYDGSYSRSLRDGVGVTTALLEAHGIEVFSEEELEQADLALGRLDSD